VSESSNKKFYVTTPIYYVNDQPHIGHAYTTLLADVFTRYHKLLGHETRFLTGTDEHGQKVEESAKKRGIKPQQHCDEMSQRFTDLFKTLNFEYDRFIRTTDADHVALVTYALTKLHNEGWIYLKGYEGLYYVSDEVFVTEDQAEKIKAEKPNAEIIPIKEKNYFFKMSEFQTKLIDYINDNPTFIQPDFRKNEVLGFLKQPLQDLCISRPKSRLEWGIELPFDKEYVCYVWVDALLNYVTGVKNKDDNVAPEAIFEQWRNHPADLQLVGKDILTIHAVYWPTLLMALGLPLPKMLFAHGWWLIGGEKMSKSVGNVIRPLELIDKLGGVDNGGVDAFRHLLTRGMILGQDATLTEDRMKAIVNGELANDLGNLLSRVAKLVQQYLGGVIPEYDYITSGQHSINPDVFFELEIHNFILTEQSPKSYNLNEYNFYWNTIWQQVGVTNTFFDSNTPWSLVKADLQKATEVLAKCLKFLYDVSLALAPVMPQKMSELRTILSCNNSYPSFQDIDLPLQSGKPLNLLKPLFPRIDFEKAFAQEQKVKQLREKLVEVHEKLETNLITIDEFKKAELRVAQILSASRIEGAKKLLLLQLDDGNGVEHPRQIVAGIAEHYEPEKLIGQKIIIVANLQPVKLRGNESNGMLLAAKADGKLVLVTVSADISNGASVG